MPAVSFPDHVALVNELLTRHQTIVEHIESRLLNVQGKDVARNRSRDYFDRALDSCFYDTPGVPRVLAELKGQLYASHLADGFEPVVLDGAAHTLDPLELILRAYDIWDHARWPGRNGRLAYARVLFGVFLLRQLEALSLRIWDDDPALAGDRLQEIQRMLDRLNDRLRPNVLIRDARWLIQTAQGPLTRHLAPYFRIADKIGQSFTGESGLALHAAGAKLAGGHLRSQLRRRSSELNVPADDPVVLAVTRNSNSMDTALLVRELVPLLDAYQAACLRGDPDARLHLADAIVQGISADPQLFVTRLDLLGPCTVVEDVFLEHDTGGSIHLTPAGTAHEAALHRYGQLIRVTAPRLREDAAVMDPERCPYSPFGIVYGFCADLLSNLALCTLHGQSVTGPSLEDLFVTRVDAETILTYLGQWERSSARGGTRERFEYSREWAGRVFQRTVDALDLRMQSSQANAANLPSARVFVVTRDQKVGSSVYALPDGIVSAQDHCVSSDVNRALAKGTSAFPRSQILADRNEGRFLGSADIDGKWFGVSKTILSEVIGRGFDALIVDVPEQIVAVLRVTCPGLIVVVGDPT
jgi:hypothetical protein